MKYNIEYVIGNYINCCIASSRTDLIEKLKLFKGETITDIRKIYKSGVSDSVIEKYRKYLKEDNRDAGQ